MYKLCLSRAFVSALVAGTFFFGTALAQAQQAGKELTPRAATASLASLKKYYEIKKFRIGGKYDLDRPDSWANGGEGGVTLESLGAGPLRLSYIAVGTPKRNAKGEITNAIIISSYYSGDASAMYSFWQEGQPFTKLPFSAAHVGKGKLFDTDRYYVIYLDALGLWGTSKPSEGLGMKFPQYNMFDLVQANYRLLRDHLKVGQVQLATGVSMGGTQTYVWGLLHSRDGFVKAIMPIGGKTQAAYGEDPVGDWIFQLMTAAIESDPVWRETKGNYYHLPKEQHPNQGVAFGWSMLSHTGFGLDFRANSPWSAVEKEVFYWDAKGNEGASQKAKAAIFDAVDLIYRNRAGGPPVSIQDRLGQIKARTLVLHVENDQWLVSDFARQSAQKIPGAQFASFGDNYAHYAVFKAAETLKNDPLVNTFLRDIGIIADPELKFVARNYRSPRVDMKAEAGKSFWKDKMVYPFPVKYAKAKDSKGITWNVAYMDEYNGTEKNPPVLVIVHGKGAFGAHYGYLMKYALERGLRVVVPDIPHYGLSGSSNLDKSNARTLSQVRDVLHDVVVRQLGIKSAHYQGHSLGGQVILGYALRYPAAVKSLILEAPAGTEQATRVTPGLSVALHEKSVGADMVTWKSAWGAMLDQEMGKTPQQIRDFFEWKGASGYFKANTEYARLHTDQRIAILDYPKERDQYITSFIYDVWAMTNENIKEDPNSMYKQLPKLRMPIFLQFGAQEPFIPITAVSGLKSLAREVIVPFKDMMTKAGNSPFIKIYPGAGHFIHTDLPYEYAKDTVDFVRKGKAENVSNAAIISMIEGAAVAKPAAAPTQTAAKPGGLSK